MLVLLLARSPDQCTLDALRVNKQSDLKTVQLWREVHDRGDCTQHLNHADLGLPVLSLPHHVVRDLWHPVADLGVRPVGEDEAVRWVVGVLRAEAARSRGR